MDFRVFSSKIVHGELQRAGYRPPSLRTVARWTSSGKAPAWAEQAMRELLGVETKAAPPDERMERLMRTVDAIAERLGVSEERAAIDAAVAALLPSPPSETDEDPLEDDLTGAGRPGGPQ